MNSGIFDSFGKEIKEGDIVKINIGHRSIEDEVIFKHGAFQFKNNFSGKVNIPLTLYQEIEHIRECGMLGKIEVLNENRN